MKESEIRNQDILDQYLSIVEADVKKLFDKGRFESVPCPACGGGRTHRGV